MGVLVELSADECKELISAQVVGRAAICTPTGPHVVPVNFSIHEDSVVFRTTPYSVLGTYGWSGDIAFEVDSIDTSTRTGWSVVVVGRGEIVEDIEEIEQIRWAHEPGPWAAGPRALYVRIRWRDITGRRIA